MEDKYIVFVKSREVRTFDNGIMTPEGQWFRVDVGVSAEIGREVPAPDVVAEGARMFSTSDAAHLFVTHWGGAPWWVKPTGEYVVRRVRAVYERRVKGWELA